MAGRTETDPALSHARGNTSPGFKSPENCNIPAGIYRLAWLDSNLYTENQYIVCQKLETGNSIVRMWDNTSEQLSDYLKIGPTGRYQYTVKFLVAHQLDIVAKPQQPNHAIHPKAVYVDSDSLPNIYAGTNESGEIGTIVKENGVYVFLTHRTSTQETTKSQGETFSVLCRK